MAPFPFRDNDDDLSRWEDPDPVECCRHEIPVTMACDACAEAADERRSSFDEADVPFASNF